MRQNGDIRGEGTNNILECIYRKLIRRKEIMNNGLLENKKIISIFNDGYSNSYILL
ncbi:hypothetical protein UT300003_25240 [Clostridium sardiniense]